jgi:AraC family transcriptional regulator of arabinose operon
MAQGLRVTPAPNPAPIVLGLQEGRSRIRGHRPQGTRDHLIVLTLDGGAYFRSGGKEFKARAGDITIIQPGTPHDYGLDEEAGYLKDIWVHVHPRVAWLEWLRWPSPAPGHLQMRLSPRLFADVENDLRMAEDAVHSGNRLGNEVAMNALERAILRCATVNLRGRNRRPSDPRIEQAAAWLGRNYSSAVNIDDLARQSGMSRSQFYPLFLRQTGRTPIAYIEQQRMERARHLLAYTTMTVSEIAEQLGYGSPYYFSLRFKKSTACSPKRYRQTQKG